MNTSDMRSGGTLPVIQWHRGSALSSALWRTCHPWPWGQPLNLHIMTYYAWVPVKVLMCASRSWEPLRTFMRGSRDCARSCLHRRIMFCNYMYDFSAFSAYGCDCRVIMWATWMKSTSLRLLPIWPRWRLKGTLWRCQVRTTAALNVLDTI